MGSALLEVKPQIPYNVLNHEHAKPMLHRKT